jgi:hypothetical protein
MGHTMKRCAQCGGRLGLGVKFRNLWNGREWVHLRFCSGLCEDAHELAHRRELEQSRWLSAQARRSA